MIKEEIKTLLEDALPTVDFNAEFLFEQLDSYGIITILTLLSQKYSIPLGMQDATPKNLISLDALVHMVESKLE